MTKFDFAEMTEGKVDKEYEINDVDAKVSPRHVGGDVIHDVAENDTKVGTSKNKPKWDKGEETNGRYEDGAVDISMVQNNDPPNSISECRGATMCWEIGAL